MTPTTATTAVTKTDRPSISQPWNRFEFCLSHPAIRTIYVYGPPGIGKTHLAYHSGRLGNGVYAVTMTEDTPAAELRGHFIPKGNGMVWHDGPFVRAMREGSRLVVNEITHAPAEVHSILHPVLESLSTARLTLPSGETVVPKDGFHVVATDNKPPEELPEALQDRFDAVCHIDTPCPDAISKLRQEHRSMAEAAATLKDDRRRISLRGWFVVERLMESAFDTESAFRIAFGDERAREIIKAMKLTGEIL